MFITRLSRIPTIKCVSSCAVPLVCAAVTVRIMKQVCKHVYYLVAFCVCEGGSRGHISFHFL